MPTPPAVEVACPHYPPAGLTNPFYICRGCGSEIANARHPQNQALGFTAETVIASPQSINVPRKNDRRA